MMTEPEPSGLYVHIPFCRAKCCYCAFYSVADTRSLDAWLDALGLEARLYAGQFERFDTLYLGGGSPSWIGLENLRRVLRLMRDTFTILPSAEVTVEVNPADVTAELLQGLHREGVNRLSLGVQAYDDATLCVLGRRHRTAEAEEAVKQARGAGFDSVGIDLIYGVPEQSRVTWQRTLRRAVELAPEHISCYMLTVEQGTPLGLAVAQGRLRPPSEAVLARAFLETSEKLEQEGYSHYEVSNFARGREHRSRHNAKYWRHVPYLGLGPSAHSFQGTKRWWNVRSVRGYIAELGARQAPVEGSELLTEQQLALESLSLGLRTSDGIPAAMLQGAAERVADLITRGWLRRQDERLVPTRQGLLFADRMALELSDCLRDASSLPLGARSEPHER